MSPLAILRTVLLCGLLSLVACATSHPVDLVCYDTVLSSRPGAIDCREALTVAITALPPGDHPVRAEFDYGTNCGATSGCGLTPQANRADFGLVTFSYAGAARQEYMYVVADASGRPRLGGTLSASPPPLMSVPTPIP